MGITVQDGAIVVRDGAVGTSQDCCCLCPYCSSSCLEVTFSDWSGTVEGCDCVDLNGTYLLTRGSGCQPGVTAVVVDDIGSGAVLEVTLAFDAATGTYYVSAVTVISAGSNYTADATVTVSVFGGYVFAGDMPVISVTQQREEPDGLSLIVDALALGPGSGETLTPVWQTEDTTSGSETWSVASVTVTSGGNGFEEYSPVRFDIQTAAEIESEVVSFDGFAVVDHAEPVVDTISVDTAGGSGATFSITWEIDSTATDFLLAQYPGSDSRHWRIASLTITNGGSGYAAGEEVSLTLDGRHIDYALGEAAASYLLGTVSVDGSGAITGTSFTAGSGPSLYRTDGIIQSVVIQDDGEYYENSGITGATVQNPGTILAAAAGAVEGGGGGSGRWPDGGILGCVYALCETIDCGGTSACRRITLSITSTNRTLAVYVDDVEVLSGEIAAEDNPCNDMTFSSGDFTGACSPGTASVASATCDGVGTEQACCCRCSCADYGNLGLIEIFFNETLIEAEYFVTIGNAVCVGNVAGNEGCAFDGEECTIRVARTVVCKPSRQLPAGFLTAEYSFMNDLLDDNTAYVILTLDMFSGDSRCLFLTEHRIYKLVPQVGDCCIVTPELDSIIVLRGDADRGIDLTGTGLGDAGFPLAPESPPESCSCFDAFFLDPEITVCVNPLP